MEWTNLLPSIKYSEDQRNFGSYGDGALVFPKADGTVGVAHRFKIVRESMYDLEYLIQMNTDERKEFDAIFVSNSDFSKDYGRYDALRDRIANRLAGNVTQVPVPSPGPKPSPVPTAIPTQVQAFSCTKQETNTGFKIDCSK